MPCLMTRDSINPILLPISDSILVLQNTTTEKSLSKIVALANFQFKIITKIFVDSLASIASKVVSEQQRGFIQGRQFSNCAILALEAKLIFVRYLIRWTVGVFFLNFSIVEFWF
jgi:hypothetical protein